MLLRRSRRVCDVVWPRPYQRLKMRGRIAILVVLMWCVTLVGCGSSARRSTDPDFILRVNSMSPNGELRLLEYQYDIGALGYSRTWWAVTPPRFEGLDLTPYEMPYGYMAVGWSPANELLVESWKSLLLFQLYPRLQRDHDATLYTTHPFHWRLVSRGACRREST